MRRQPTVYATIRPGEESGYIGECAQLHAVTQGSSLDEAAENLRESVVLALEDNEGMDFGPMDGPVIIVTLELMSAPPD